MALSAIDLSSRALIKIGANSITTFDEGTLESHVAATLYPVVRDAMLSAHPWNFAITQRSLARAAQIPLADHQWAFGLPEDCLRVLSAGSGGRGRGISYRIQSRLVCTDSDDVILTYLFRPDEGDFPPFFSLALIARLAAEFCIPLTDSTSRWTSLYRIAEDEFRRAKLMDAQEDTPPRFEDFTLIEGRG